MNLAVLFDKFKWRICRNDLRDTGSGAEKAKCEIGILGEMRPARLLLDPLSDPKWTRMRG